MCRMASFLWRKSEANGLQIAVWDLESHSNTQDELKLTEKMGWYEGHYLPDGQIECRTPDGVDGLITDEVKLRYPTYSKFIAWCLTQNINSGSLDLRGCDLKGVKLPESVGGSLDLSGCDLKGVKLPQSVGGWLDLSGCDLKGIKLPQSVGGSLDLSGCDLKGIKLPKSVGGSLYLSGCDLKGVEIDTAKYSITK